jgi:hypothetical protein
MIDDDDDDDHHHHHHRHHNHRHVKNEGVLQSVKEERKILHTVKKNEGYLDWSHLA